MKITFESMERGITQYLDQELKAQYPEDSIQRLAIGVAMALLLKPKMQEAKAMLESDLMKSSGVVDKDGLIDADLLRDTIKSEMAESGIRFDSMFSNSDVINKFLGVIVLHKDDIDTIYKYMTAVR